MNRKTLKGNLIIILTTELDKRIFNLQSIRASVREKNWSDVRTGGLRRRRLPGKSGPFGHWSGDQRVCRWSGTYREVDRQSGQQRRGIRRADGSSAVRRIAQGAKAACVFRLGSSCEADDGAVYLPQSAALLFALDLPQAGARFEVFHLARAA